jgi:lipopolysaccharide export system protein LptA
MTKVGTTFPAQVLVVQAEIRLVADQTENAAPVTIKADEQAVIDAEEIAKANSLIDIVA